MKGYKAFKSDLTCRDFQFEIGKEYKHEGEIQPCSSGFHFCKTIADCYRFYATNNNTRICEVEALGEVKTDGRIKFVTDYIKIISEVDNPCEKSNTGKSNSGYCNTGNWNTGNWNFGNGNTGDDNGGDYNSGDDNGGDYNSGSRNSGSCNSGNWNSGRYNSGSNNDGNGNTGNANIGDWNSGSENKGSYNSGNCNSGRYNSGYWNAGNWNAGIFNTNLKPRMMMFDELSDWTIDDWLTSDAYKLLHIMPINVSDDDRQKWWDELNVNKDKIFRTLPNFDEEKFCKCVGIKKF